MLLVPVPQLFQTQNPRARRYWKPLRLYESVAPPMPIIAGAGGVAIPAPPPTANVVKACGVAKQGVNAPCVL